MEVLGSQIKYEDLFKWRKLRRLLFTFQAENSNLAKSTILVCEILRSFERARTSKFPTQGFLSILNSRKIFERDLLSSDSVGKSATQNLGFSVTDMNSNVTP